MTEPEPIEEKPRNADRKKHVEVFFLWLIIGIFSFLYIALGWQNYTRLETGIDLAGYAQALYNLSHFRLPFNSFMGIVMWGDHAHFIMALLAPFYWLWPDARFLIIIQTLAVTTSGWAFFQLAKKLTKSVVLSFVFLYSYLAFIGIQYALNDNFHPSVLTGALITWMLYGFFFEKYWVYWITFVLALLTREDAPTILFMIGLYELFRKKWKVAVPTMIIAATYFLIVVYAVMPIWAHEHGTLLYLDGSDKSIYGILHGFWKYPIAIIQNTFDTIEKRQTTTTLLSSFSFFSLLSPFTYLGAAPIIYARFNSTQDYRWLITNYSNANIWPIISFGALLGVSTILKLLRRFKRAWVAIVSNTLICIALILGVQYTAWNDSNAPLKKTVIRLLPDQVAYDHFKAFLDIKKYIPANDEVSSSAGFLAPLSNRRQLQNFPNITSQTKWILVSRYGNPWPLNRDQAEAQIKKLQKNSDWQLAVNREDIWLFKRSN